jgi:hypothetical protein
MFSCLKRASLFDGFQEPLKRIHFAIGLQMWTYLVHQWVGVIDTGLRENTLCDCNREKCLAAVASSAPDPECVDPNCEGSVKPQDAEDLKLLIQVGG